MTRRMFLKLAVLALPAVTVAQRIGPPKPIETAPQPTITGVKGTKGGVYIQWEIRKWQ